MRYLQVPSRFYIPTPSLPFRRRSPAKTGRLDQVTPGHPMHGALRRGISWAIMYCNQSAIYLCLQLRRERAEYPPSPTGELALARGQCIRNKFQVGLRGGIIRGRHYWVLLASFVRKCIVGVVRVTKRSVSRLFVLCCIFFVVQMMQHGNPTTQALARVRLAGLLQSSTTYSRKNLATSSRGPNRGRLSRCWTTRGSRKKSY